MLPILLHVLIISVVVIMNYAVLSTYVHRALSAFVYFMGKIFRNWLLRKDEDF